MNQSIKCVECKHRYIDDIGKSICNLFNSQTDADWVLANNHFTCKHFEERNNNAVL